MPLKKPDIRVVMYKPQEEGNVGSAARAMMNFGFSELYLVDPLCKIGDVAYALASHGSPVLDNAKMVHGLESAVSGCDYIIGTTGKKGGHETPKRVAVTPAQLSSSLPRGKLAIVFGNEAHGLPNELLRKTDFVVRIPANPKYPILNLAQSVCIILYELSKTAYEKTVKEKPPSREMLTRLDRFARGAVDAVYDQPHQRKATGDTLSRVYGKAMLTSKEAGRLMSLYRKTLKKLDET